MLQIASAANKKFHDFVGVSKNGLILLSGLSATTC